MLALPSVVVAVLLLRSLRYLQSFAPERQTGQTRVGEDRPGAFALLLGVVTARTVGWFGLLTFVPPGPSSSDARGLWEQSARAMLFAGGAGTLAVGPLADRIGRRPVLLASVISVPPLTLVYVAVGGTVGVVALALVGVCVVGTGLIQVMTQEMPNRLGLASGISIGFAIGLGGVAAAALGAVADAIDLEAALYISATVPALAIPLALLLPSPRGGGRRKLPPSRWCRLAAIHDDCARVFRGPRGQARSVQDGRMTNSYVFEIGAGTWRVDVDDGMVKVAEDGGDGDARRHGAQPGTLPADRLRGFERHHLADREAQGAGWPRR